MEDGVDVWRQHRDRENASTVEGAAILCRTSSGGGALPTGLHNTHARGEPGGRLRVGGGGPVGAECTDRAFLGRSSNLKLDVTRRPRHRRRGRLSAEPAGVC